MTTDVASMPAGTGILDLKNCLATPLSVKNGELFLDMKCSPVTLPRVASGARKNAYQCSAALDVHRVPRFPRGGRAAAAGRRVERVERVGSDGSLR